MKRKDILLLLVPSVVLVIFWVVFSIYHNSVTSTIPPKVNVQMKPIDPEFDMETFSELKKRVNIKPLTEIEAVVTTSPTPKIENQQASQGGSLQE